VFSHSPSESPLVGFRTSLNVAPIRHNAREKLNLFEDISYIGRVELVNAGARGLGAGARGLNRHSLLAPISYITLWALIATTKRSEESSLSASGVR